MVAATKHRNTTRVGGFQVSDPVAAATRIFAGTMVGLDASGNAVPATPTTPVMRGVADHGADNASGAAGDLNVQTTRNHGFKFNAVGLTRANIKQDVYVVDDQTVGASGTLIAGKLIDIDDGGAVVYIS
ncbi:MAG: hypothetical protein AAF618_00035 [Pseudomonadota bacterium]